MNSMGASLSSKRLAEKSSLLVRREADDDEFSSPCARLLMKGVELPRSGASPRARRGLLEVVRLRGEERKGAERRKANFFLLPAGAVAAAGASGKAAMGLAGLCVFGVKARDRASGEMGERGESAWRMVKREGLEGERDRERRSCCIDEKWVPSRR